MCVFCLFLLLVSFLSWVRLCYIVVIISPSQFRLSSHSRPWQPSSQAANGAPSNVQSCSEGSKVLLAPYVMQWCVRVGSRASGPQFGRILGGQASKSALRPAEDRPDGRL